MAFFVHLKGVSINLTVWDNDVTDVTNSQFEMIDEILFEVTQQAGSGEIVRREYGVRPFAKTK